MSNLSEKQLDQIKKGVIAISLNLSGTKCLVTDDSLEMIKVFFDDVDISEKDEIVIVDGKLEYNIGELLDKIEPQKEAFKELGLVSGEETEIEYLEDIIKGSKKKNIIFSLDLSTPNIILAIMGKKYLLKYFSEEQLENIQELLKGVTKLKLKLSIPVSAVCLFAKDYKDMASMLIKMQVQKGS